MLRSLVPLSSERRLVRRHADRRRPDVQRRPAFTYQFKRAARKPSLNVGIRLADPSYDLEGFLVDPNGQPLDVQSTAQFDASDNLLGFGPTMQFFRGSRPPACGL